MRSKSRTNSRYRNSRHTLKLHPACSLSLLPWQSSPSTPSQPYAMPSHSPRRLPSYPNWVPSPLPLPSRLQEGPHHCSHCRYYPLDHTHEHHSLYDPSSKIVPYSPIRHTVGRQIGAYFPVHHNPIDSLVRDSYPRIFPNNRLPMLIYLRLEYHPPHPLSYDLSQLRRWIDKIQ